MERGCCCFLAGFCTFYYVWWASFATCPLLYLHGHRHFVFAPLLFYVFFCSCLTFFSHHTRGHSGCGEMVSVPPLPMACGLACFLCCFRFLSSLWFLLALRIFTLFSPFTVFFRTFCGVDFSLIANTKLQNKSNPHRRRKKATNVSFTFSSSFPVLYSPPSSVTLTLPFLSFWRAVPPGWRVSPLFLSFPPSFLFSTSDCGASLSPCLFFSGCTFGVFDWLRFGIKIGRFF